MNDLRIEFIAGRKICIGGVGKLFFEQGFPISMSIQLLMSKNIEVSILHVVDELINHGWGKETIFKKIKADLEDCMDDKKAAEAILLLVYKFLSCSYELQRDMIFQILFYNSKEQASSFFETKLYEEIRSKKEDRIN